MHYAAIDSDLDSRLHYRCDWPALSMWLTPDHDRHDSNDQWPAFSKQSFSSSQSLHLAGAQMYDARSGWCLVVASVQPLHYYFPIHTPIPWYCWAIDYFPRYVYHPSHSQPNVNKNLYRRNILNLSPINHGLLSSSCDYFPNPTYVCLSPLDPELIQI